MRSSTVLGILLFYTSASGVLAEDHTAQSWTEFRNGGSSHTASTMPEKWSDDSGIAWQRELPGYGQSSPVIYDQKLFLTAVIGPMKEECVVICLDLNSGEPLWEYRQPASAKAASNYSASRAAPTPMVDAQAVYAFFESGDVVALNHAGVLQWRRSLTNDYGKFENNHGLGSSPTQTSQLVVLNIEHKGPSYLIGLNKSSGENVWKVDRPSVSSWTSPIVIQHDGKEIAVVSSGGTVDGYDTESGKQLWTVGGLSGNSVPSPTAVGPYLFVGARLPEFGSVTEAAQSNLCMKLNSVANGEYEVVWRAAKAVCDYASPVVDRNCAYYLNNVGVLHCIDSTTGDTCYTERLGTTCWATPIVAGDNVYFFGKDGTTQVIRSGTTFEKVSTNRLWDPSKPPAPETYQEHQGGEQEHGGTSLSAAEAKSSEPTSATGSSSPRTLPETAASDPAPRRSGRGGGMAAMLQRADANGDGVISGEELSGEFKEMLQRVDLNQDGQLDTEEIKAMEESFRKRREGSRESARDPIVYGVAAANGAFVIRTGTRVYCVRGANP